MERLRNMAQRNEDTGGLSRRGFLKEAAFGLGGGLAALSVLTSKSLLSRRRKHVADFPEDSIFAPAKKHHDRI